jgi:hypothetical protein
MLAIVVAALVIPLASMGIHAHAASSTARGWNVVGRPTVSANFINRVLAAYHSPAATTGQALYADGVMYGIDPAFALAFFLHESNFGTAGIAQVTHSLGNIRCTPGYPSCYQGFRQYSTWQDGYLDWYKLIRNVYVTQWGLTTVDQIIPVYAPSSDNNNVQAYIAAVEHAVTTWRSRQVIVH